MASLSVVDVETTGKYPYQHDRIVEVAMVRVIPSQGIVNELTTLVNPERDVGPTHIHGITASDVIHAPRFLDIAGLLASFMGDTVAMVGHNVRFDISFLQTEYSRIGVEMPNYEMIDTLLLAGRGTLSACCEKHGIQFDGKKHSALHDARACAHLLLKFLDQRTDILAKINSTNLMSWSPLAQSSRALFPRENLKDIPYTTPTYIQRLAEQLSIGSMNRVQSEGERDYRYLLQHCLEDGVIEESEGDSLVDMAVHWGLSHDSVKAIHRELLLNLVKAAWKDRNITDAERREIQSLAHLLGFGQLSDMQIHELLQSSEILINPEMSTPPAENWEGMNVCFTGECGCSIGGQIISRENAEEIASNKGLHFCSTVTKKLNILVVSDPNTQSGKAKKARQYGVRIIHEPVFWRSLGISTD